MGFQDWGWGVVSGTAGKFPPNFREWQEGVTKKLKMKILFIFLLDASSQHVQAIPFQHWDITMKQIHLTSYRSYPSAEMF